MPDSSRLIITLAKIIAVSAAAVLLAIGICAVNNNSSFGLGLFILGVLTGAVSLLILVFAAIAKAIFK